MMISRSIFLSLVAMGSMLSCPAKAQTRSETTVITANDPEARKFGEQFGFSDAVVAGELIYLSGVVVWLPTGDKDVAGAFDRSYKHIGEVLQRAGANYDDIVDITSFHTDLNAQIKFMSEVQKRYLKAPYPAWTAIDVDRLLPDVGIAEIKIIARKSSKPN